MAFARPSHGLRPSPSFVFLWFQRTALHLWMLLIFLTLPYVLCPYKVRVLGLKGLWPMFVARPLSRPRRRSTSMMLSRELCHGGRCELLSLKEETNKRDFEHFEKISSQAGEKLLVSGKALCNKQCLARRGTS